MAHAGGQGPGEGAICLQVPAAKLARADRLPGRLPLGVLSYLSS